MSEEVEVKREFKTKRDEDYYKHVLDHKELVKKYIGKIINELRKRAESHDDSKLEEREFSIMAQHVSNLKNIQYGTEEYEKNIENMKPILDIHYVKNDHHPEHTRRNEEQWKDIKDFEGYYKINNFGEIKRIERIQIRKNNRKNTIKERLLIPNITPYGYLQVQLKKDNEITKNVFVHNLVANAFLDIPDNEKKTQINHINGDKQDNYYKNLEWVTPSENVQHAYDLGLKRPAYKCVVKCNELDIVTLGIDEMVDKLHEKGYKKARGSSIYACISGKNKTHLDLTFTSYNIEEYQPKSDIRFMSLINLIEMCIDIMASAIKHDNESDVRIVIAKHRAKYGYSNEIAQILENTIRYIKFDNFEEDIKSE